MVIKLGALYVYVELRTRNILSLNIIIAKVSTNGRGKSHVARGFSSFRDPIYDRDSAIPVCDPVRLGGHGAVEEGKGVVWSSEE